MGAASSVARLDLEGAQGLVPELLPDQFYCMTVDEDGNDDAEGSVHCYFEDILAHIGAAATSSDRVATALAEVTAEALRLAGSSVEAPHAEQVGALLAYAPESADFSLPPLKVGERVYVLEGAFFWPATISNVRSPDVIDVAYVPISAPPLRRLTFRLFSYSRYLHAKHHGNEGDKGLEVNLTTKVRPEAGSKWDWTAATATESRVDRRYYFEADKMVALLALGAPEEPDGVARSVVKRWFAERYNLGTNSCGADLWTFALARAASLARLDSLGRGLEAIYEHQELGKALGPAADPCGVEGHRVRSDDGIALPGLVEWMRSGESDLWWMRSEDSDLSTDTCYTHALVMLGLAVDPHFSADLAAIFGSERVKLAPVKRVARMTAKFESDYADEALPRSACNCDVVRCGVTSGTPEALKSDLTRLLAEGKVLGLRLLRSKNGWKPDDAHRQSRKERYGYASLMLNFEYAPAGVTYGSLAKAAGALWESYSQSQPTWDATLSAAARAYLCSDAIANEQVRFVCEVQLQLQDYVTHGRLKTHLHYKIARTADTRTLLNDFRAGSLYAKDGTEAAFAAAVSAYAEGVAVAREAARAPTVDEHTVRLEG